MEKKRKRASFSPPSGTKSKITHAKKEEEEKPAIKQVVEVVIEEPTVRVVIPREEEEEKKKTQLVSEEDEELDEDEDDLGEEEERITQKQEVVDEKDQSQDEERQKETVAELFGKNSQSVMPEITVHTHSGSRGIVIWGITMIAIAIGVGGGLVLFANRGTSPQVPFGTTSEPTPSPSEAPKPTPTPSPEPSLRSDLKVQVWNGGGVVGAGAKAKAFLEEKGYDVIDVANAPDYGYETTEVVIKASKAGNLDMIKKDLGEEYEVGDTKTTLPETSSYDIRVIVGKS